MPNTHPRRTIPAARPKHCARNTSEGVPEAEAPRNIAHRWLWTALFPVSNPLETRGPQCSIRFSPYLCQERSKSPHRILSRCGIRVCNKRMGFRADVLLSPPAPNCSECPQGQAVERGKGNALQQMRKRNTARAGALGRPGRMGLPAVHEQRPQARGASYDRGDDPEARGVSRSQESRLGEPQACWACLRASNTRNRGSAHHAGPFAIIKAEHAVTLSGFLPFRLPCCIFYE